MLGHLHIKNLAVLSEASVEFAPGWNVLTGETGAGKSIVVDSLALLTGARASADLIRTDAETLTVTGTFEGADDTVNAALEEAGLDGRRRRAGGAPRDQPLRPQPRLRQRSARDPPLAGGHHARVCCASTASVRSSGWRSPSSSARGWTARAASRRSSSRRAWRASTPSTAGWPNDSRASTAASRCGERGSSWSRSRSPRSSGRPSVEGEDDELRRERDSLRNHEAIARALGGLVSTVLDDEGSATERLAAAASGLESIVEWQSDAADLDRGARGDPDPRRGARPHRARPGRADRRRSRAARQGRGPTGDRRASVPQVRTEQRRRAGSARVVARGARRPRPRRRGARRARSQGHRRARAVPRSRDRALGAPASVGEDAGDAGPPRARRSRAAQGAARDRARTAPARG